MIRTWTTVGTEAVDRIGRPELEAEIERFDWQEIPEGGKITVGFIPGMAINEAIRELRLPKASHIAISAFERPSSSPLEDGYYPGFYGVECHYSNGRARVYLVDEGSTILPVASDFWEATPATESGAADEASARCESGVGSERPRLTTRERRLARAERLREWAGKRETAAGAVLKSHEVYRGDHAFNFQPGYIPERARVIRQDHAAFASLDKARSMSSRADEIDRQARNAIYSDDPDVAERLTEKITRLEAKRDAMKAANAEYRKEHRAELKAMSAYERSQAVPHPSWSITNLGATIRTAKQRLAAAQSTAAAVAEGEAPGPRTSDALPLRRHDGVALGELLAAVGAGVYYRPTREAICANCDEATTPAPVASDFWPGE